MPRVLEVDDVEAAVAQHQVAAVIVAVAEHARLGGQLVDDRRPLRRAAPPVRVRRERDAAVALEEVLREEVELPRQLLDVERDAVRQVAVRLQLAAAPLQLLDERDRLRGRAPRARAGVAAPRCACSVTSPRSCSARMPSASEWPRIGGTGSGICCQQRADVGERQRREIDRPGVQRQHDRRAVSGDDPEVAPVRRVAGQRHDRGRAGRRDRSRPGNCR